MTQTEIAMEQRRNLTSADFSLVNSLALNLHTCYQTITANTAVSAAHTTHTQLNAMMTMNNVHNENASELSNCITS
jgi:hypothetical protein